MSQRTDVRSLATHDPKFHYWKFRFQYFNLPDHHLPALHLHLVPPACHLVRPDPVNTNSRIRRRELFNLPDKLLDRPLKKGGNTEQQNSVVESFGRIINGSVVQRDKKFYLKMKGKGEFEMGLVSEGYRKLATIIYLIYSGSLNENSILFWDEPETNMNPMMIKPIAEAVAKLAEMGVQVFITTHDYFVQQSFNLLSAYPAAGAAPPEIKFISLYKEDDRLLFEEGATVSELNHNSIMEEFDNLYDREQDLIYGN